MNKSQLAKRYYNAPAACRVLGAIINKPILFKNYKVEKEDFIDPLHKVVFVTVNNLIAQDIEEIGFAEIENYLSTIDKTSHKKIFGSEDNKEWLYDLIDQGSPVNFEYYHNILRKYSLLREYISEGNDVSDILDLEELDNKILQEQKEDFNKMSIEDIIKIMDSKNLNAKKRFSQINVTKVRKAGDDAEELWKEIQETPSYGLNSPSGYMNRITNGITGNTLRIVSKDSGCGRRSFR